MRYKVSNHLHLLIPPYRYVKLKYVYDIFQPIEIINVLSMLTISQPYLA